MSVSLRADPREFLLLLIELRFQGFGTGFFRVQLSGSRSSLFSQERQFLFLGRKLLQEQFESCLFLLNVCIRLFFLFCCLCCLGFPRLALGHINGDRRHGSNGRNQRRVLGGHLLSRGRLLVVLLQKADEHGQKRGLLPL